MRDATVVVVGSVNMDEVVRVDRLPQPGETVLGHDLDRAPGGKGANQAVAAARLGAAADLIGRVGDDEAGRMLTSILQGEGVGTSTVSTTQGTPTGVALITVDAAGDNMIVVAPMANAALSPADVEAAAGVITGARVLLCQLEIPLPTVVRALEVARAAGVLTVLNAAPARALDAAVLALVDVLVANEHEAAALRESLQPLPVKAAVVTLGAGGAVVVEDGRRTELRSFPVHAVDTTGAGDAFCGALAAGLAEGASVAEAATSAVAAGALAVTRPGALPSLPTAAEVSALLEQTPT